MSGTLGRIYWTHTVDAMSYHRAETWYGLLPEILEKDSPQSFWQISNAVRRRFTHPGCKQKSPTQTNCDSL